MCCESVEKMLYEAKTIEERQTMIHELFGWLRSIYDSIEKLNELQKEFEWKLFWTWGSDWSKKEKERWPETLNWLLWNLVLADSFLRSQVKEFEETLFKL